MQFTTPLYFLLVLLIVPSLWWARSQRKALGHSQVSSIGGMRSPFIGRLPGICRTTFIGLLLLMAAGPQLVQKISHMVIQSRDFIITVDVSGSMHSTLSDPDQQKFAQTSQASQPNGQPVDPFNPTATPGASSGPMFSFSGSATPDSSAAPPPPTRAMAAREGVRQFLLRRKGDRVGLIIFDDRCYYKEPLGKPEAVVKKLDAILYSGGGTNFDGPSKKASRTGAIAGSIRHFIEMHATKTRVLIMVTDGEDEMDPDRMAVLAKLIHDEHIRMYVLGVGEGWGKDKKSDLQKFVELPEVAGQVIPIGDARQMREAFDRIDKLEKSDTEIEILKHAQELYPFIAMAAFVVLLIWIRVAAYVRDQM